MFRCSVSIFATKRVGCHKLHPGIKAFMQGRTWRGRGGIDEIVSALHCHGLADVGIQENVCPILEIQLRAFISHRGMCMDL